ncbi:MAG: M14 family zinc carboxypeptidase, partial [Candidatus Bathyarchaeia archaeon]
MPEREIPSPEKFYGFQMGADRKLARWDKIVEYFWLLDKRTDRVKVIELGKSTEGNPFLLAIITSAENMKNLEKISEMSWRIAHPKGLSEKEVENIVKNGRTVVAITNSIHASEVGGTQMSSELAYEVATSEEPKFQKIRENTVLLLFPSFNPDGNIIVVDWYNKWLGTEYEATSLPRLYHKYTGHDNNRDAFILTQVESQLVSKVLYREWLPQAYIDHHHMGGNGARYYIPPFANPVHEKVDPLIWTEQQLYGAAMIVNLERAGKTGNENAATYPGDFMPTFNYVPCWHNICGMLTESASARIATPTYVHLHQLTGGRRGRPEYRAQVNFPHPWPGGWWRLRDIVEQQKIASLATLEVAANFREMILKNMYLKAMRSINKGEEEPPYAFVLPPYQHDILTAHKLLKNLRDLGVEIHLAKKSFTSNGISYPAGSHVIFLSQPSRPFLLSLLPRTFYRDSPHTRTSEGAPLAPYDFAAQTLAEFMGVKVVEIEKKFEGDFEELETIEFPTGSVEISSGHGYLLDGRLNDSFIAVNRLLKKDIEVLRAEEEVKIGETTSPSGSFLFGY